MKILPILLSLILASNAVPSTLHAQDDIDPRAISSYLKGAFCEARNDPAGALQYYLAAKTLDPGNRRISLKAAQIAFELGDMKHARSLAKSLIGSGAYEDEAQLILVQVDYRRGDREHALQRLLELRERGGGDRLEVLKFLARVYIELGKTDEAREVLEETTRLFPGDFFAHYRLGFMHAEAGELEPAISSFERAVTVNPMFANAHLALASLMSHAGRMDKAKRAYLDALEIEPDNRQAIMELADLIYRSGDFTSGVDLLQPRYEKGELDENASIMLGRFYYRAGRDGEALGLFREIIERTGERPMLLRVIAEMEIGRGELRTALGHVERLIEIEPGPFNNYIGKVLILGGLAGEAASAGEAVGIDTAEAVRVLDKVAGRVDPDSLDDNYLVGTIYRKLGSGPDAERFLLRAEQLDRTDSNTLFELATLYEGREEYGKAIERMNRLHEIDPENASVMNFYGYLLAEKGEQLDLAERLLRRALEMEPENGYFLDSMGWIKFRQGDFAAAAGFLEEAVVRAGNDSVIWEHLGETFERLGKQGEAIGAYEKSLEVDPGNAGSREKLKRLRSADRDPEK